MKTFICLILYSYVFTSCASLQNSAKYDLADGAYKSKIKGKDYRYYIKNSPDSITVYTLPDKSAVVLPLQSKVYIPVKPRFIKPSLDIDIVTALLKIRPATTFLPAQLNANFNGNIYLGRRIDVYQIQYTKNALNSYQRQINHFGFSSGLFLGIGNTAMNPSTTNNAIQSEYDGLVLQKGVAGIIAVNKLTIGLSIGFDNLVDKNRKSWIYNNRPWFGLMLGLNLN